MPGAHDLMRPTRNILPALLVLLAMGYAGASQGNGAAYLLCFLVASVLLVSAVHTWFNLSGLDVAVEAVQPGFAGQDVVLPLEVTNRSGRPRYGLEIRVADESLEVSEVCPKGSVREQLRVPAEKRGVHRLRKIRLRSRYPLGFFEATRKVGRDRDYLVYPRPSGEMCFPRPPIGASAIQKEGAAREGDDFAGVRPYIVGESQRHIDWKAAARGQALLIKQFASESDDRLEFDWTTLSHMEYEARISQLARWVIEAERQNRTYSLRLPDQFLPPASGDVHFHRCLRALALLPLESR